MASSGRAAVMPADDAAGLPDLDRAIQHDFLPGQQFGGPLVGHAVVGMLRHCDVGDVVFEVDEKAAITGHRGPFGRTVQVYTSNLYEKSSAHHGPNDRGRRAPAPKTRVCDQAPD